MIKVIKLITGEELVAEAEVKQDGVFVKNTAIIFSNSPGKIYLGTWLPYTDAPEGALLPHNGILLVLNPDESMLKYYEKWNDAKEEQIDK